MRNQVAAAVRGDRHDYVGTVSPLEQDTRAIAQASADFGVPACTI